jgi:AAA family ATP:ADP antiporter
MMMTIYIYSTQRVVKDSIIITALGAEVISTIKLWAVMPLAILVMLLYAKLSDVLNKTKLFHILNIFFVGYWLLFTFIIQPEIKNFTLNLLSMKEKIPHLRYFFIMIENWSYVFYYVFSELWGSVMLALMFWQTTNQIFNVEQARRLYPMIGMFGQLGMLMSGTTSSFFTNQLLFNTWNQSLKYINLCILLSSFLLSLTFYILSNFVVTTDIINAEIVKRKKKIGFLEGLKHIFSSKYIGLIAIIILCYGISINLVEGVWKAQAKIASPDSQSFASFMATIQWYTGLISMFAMFCGSHIMSRISWKSAALITPVVICITGILFFVFSTYQYSVLNLKFLSVSPVFLAVVVGSVQNVLSKATKYAFFDSSKEIAYIPLDESLKSKGKAAADVIGGRLGKSGGALITWLLLLPPNSHLISIAPKLFLIFVCIMILWFISVNTLSKEFNRVSSISRTL